MSVPYMLDRTLTPPTPFPLDGGFNISQASERP